MPLTRAIVEQTLLSRCGRILAKAGLDGATADGTNPALADPIRQGLASLGLGTATLGVVVDADLLPITGATIDQLLDIAALAALEAALGNLDQPDQVADTDSSQAFGKLRDSIEATVARLRAQARARYGYGLAALAAGVIDLGFAETLDPTSGRPI